MQSMQIYNAHMNTMKHAPLTLTYLGSCTGLVHLQTHGTG
jgi:hypothetical protein